MEEKSSSTVNTQKIGLGGALLAYRLAQSFQIFQFETLSMTIRFINKTRGTPADGRQNKELNARSGLSTKTFLIEFALESNS